MGYLLKEALKTLCGLNQWSYAVFWKFGCQNPKLLIWEECFFEPVSYSNHPGISQVLNSGSGFDNWDPCWVSAEAGPSQLAPPAGNKVDLLVNKMMMENHVHVVGEGLVGRAAFTGNHQWILSGNYSGVADPPEVLKEVYQQFSAGMQTIAVIPVLPHGVVQLGSCLPVMENLGFVNDVKTLVRHLGCVPGVLLSDNYTTKEPEPNIGLPVYTGKTLSIDPSVRSDVIHSTPFIGTFITPVSSTGQVLDGEKSNVATFQASNMVQDLGKIHDEHFQEKNLTLTKPNLPSISQLLNGVTKAEVIPSNHEPWLNQQASLYNPRSTFEQHPSHMMDNLTTSHLQSGGLVTSYQLGDNIGAKTELNRKMEEKENGLFQGISIPLPQQDGPSKLNEHILGSTYGDGKLEYAAKYNDACMQQSGDDLFDILGVDFRYKLLNESWNNFPNNGSYSNDQNFKNKSTSELYSANQGNSESGIFSTTGSDNLLDAVVSSVHHSTKQNMDDNVSSKTTLTNISNSSGLATSHSYSHVSGQMPGELYGFPKPLIKAGALGSSSFKSSSSKDNPGTYSESSSLYGSQISSWVEQSHDIKQSSSASTSYTKKPDEMSKSNRKRLKPGENPRPRPKDRQMIQDRVKELREIVPNGAKCSIDALLERTIKHMLFLQSVAKHADKLKQTGESKILSKDGGLLLKDNYEGGATWAYEVGSQSTVCPIIVEDLNQPRQMLVEMLCEERGLFLEIADLIRGLGLTILKGVMETRNGKIWARFAVEANRDVTRMEIFISLVRLLEQTAKNGATPTNGIDNDATMMSHQFHQATTIPATGNPCGL